MIRSIISRKTQSSPNIARRPDIHVGAKINQVTHHVRLSTFDGIENRVLLSSWMDMVYIETEVDELVEYIDLSVGNDFEYRGPESRVGDLDLCADSIVWQVEGGSVDRNRVLTTREDVADDTFRVDVCVIERVVGRKTQVELFDFRGSQSVGAAREGDGTHGAIAGIAPFVFE